ncbi:hypothetical protein ACVB8X_07945 [Streptomyces sp. NRAIS4]
MPEDPRPRAVVAPPDAAAVPYHPYHPDPPAAGSFGAADETWGCRGHGQGWIYTGPVHVEDVPDGRLCLQPRRCCAEWGSEPGATEEFLAALDEEGRPTPYRFHCRDCGTHLTEADFARARGRTAAAAARRRPPGPWPGLSRAARSRSRGSSWRP